MSIYAMIYGANIFSRVTVYGSLIAASMLIGICAAYYLARQRGYHEDLVFWVALICIPSAIVGARLYYVIFDENGFDYWTFQRIIGYENGTFSLAGLAIYGGIIGAILASLVVWQIFKRKENPLDRITLIQMFDLFFIFIILGQAIGRWGNFANKEAYGNPVISEKWQWFPYATKGSDGNWYQATFFYESIMSFVGFITMLWLYVGKRKSFDGFVFSFYAIWYGLTRLIIEGLRSDSLMLGSVRVSQIVSTVFILSGVAIIAAHVIRAKNVNKKLFILVPIDRLSTEYFEYEKSRVSLPKRVYEKGTKKASTQSAIPASQSSWEEALADTEDTTTNDQIIAENLEDAVASTEDAVASTEDAVASTEDTVASTEDAVASTEGAVASAEKLDSDIEQANTENK